MAIEEIPLSETQVVEAAPGRRQRGLWRDAMRETFRKRSARVCAARLGSRVCIAAFAPLLAPYAELEVLISSEGLSPRSEPCIHVSVEWIPEVPVLEQVKSFLESNGFSCPSDQPQHLMGLDGNGRDEF